MSEQAFDDYKSKYLDLAGGTGEGGGDDRKGLEDLDFELELIHRDEINVA